MDKIFVSLTDKNGNNFTYNAHEIKPEEIVENIKAGSLSIDGDKLRGNDNFVIDAKRLKCSIVLPNNNEPFKDAILGLLNDKTLLMPDSMTVDEVKSIRVNHDSVVNYMSLERMWGRNYYEDDDSANWEGQTWSEDNQNSGKLILKSDISNNRYDLLKIIHAICWNYFYADYSDRPGAMYAEPGKTLNANQTLNHSTRGFEIDGIKFDIGFLNLTDFIAKGMLAHMNREHSPTAYPNDLSHISYGDYFVDYLNMISDGLGDAMKVYVVNKLNTLINGIVTDVNSLFIPDRRACGLLNYKNIQPYAWQYLDEFLCKNDTQSTYGLTFYQYVGEDESPTLYGTYQDIATWGNNANKMICRLSYFIESIIQYSWYKIVQTELIMSGYQPRRLAYNSNTSYVFLQNVMEAVVGLRRDRSGINTPAIIKYNFIHDYAIQENYNINCLKSQQGNFGTILKIGAPKSLTMTTAYDEEEEEDYAATDSGTKVIQILNNNEIEGSLYTPVVRLFYLKRSEFYSSRAIIDDTDIAQNTPTALSIFQRDNRLLVDDFDYSKIAFNPQYKSWLTNTAYLDTNWLYFDNIGIVEFSVAGMPNNWLWAPRIEIPVFDMIDQSAHDNYGLYVYRDFFEKYYTKQPSNLMDIYVNVYVQVDNVSTNIYRGVVDFGSISYDDKSISFEATDAIGLLIENLKKLESFICFSQYNEPGNDVRHLAMAGNNIKEVIESLVRNPFPYAGNLKNLEFTLPVEFGLENKVLTDLSAEDAFMAAIQLSKQLLYCDGNGKIQITSFNASEIEQYGEIDGNILSRKFDKSIDHEVFSIETIKKVAGWESFAPSVANYYNSIRRKYTDILSLEVYGQETEIKILDKIWIDNVCYIVTEISYDLRK